MDTLFDTDRPGFGPGNETDGVKPCETGQNWLQLRYNYDTFRIQRAHRYIDDTIPIHMDTKNTKNRKTHPLYRFFDTGL